MRKVKCKYYDCPGHEIKEEEIDALVSEKALAGGLITLKELEEELKMEEKYTVTLKCGNCGKTENVQIECGKPWDIVENLPKCDNCGVEDAGWERVDLK